MKYLIYLLLIFSSCSYHKTSILTKKDLLEQILQVTKDKTKNELYRQFGSPINISNLPDNADIDVLEYKSPLLHAYLNKSSKKIELIVLFNSNKDLNYEYMKKKFPLITWDEKQLTNSTHVIQDQYLVNLKDLNISFEYDKEMPVIYRINFGARN